MAAVSRKKPKFGDLVEIPLPVGGLAYAQYLNRWEGPPVYGAFIRVFRGIFTHRPADTSKVLSLPEQFRTFFPLGAACSRGLVHIISEQPISRDLQEWPLFKQFNQDQVTKERTWWIYERAKGRKVGTLPPEYFDLPLRQVIDLKVLHDRLITGWKPSDEAR